jgi:hypothetical protein
MFHSPSVAPPSFRGKLRIKASSPPRKPSDSLVIPCVTPTRALDGSLMVCDSMLHQRSCPAPFRRSPSGGDGTEVAPRGAESACEAVHPADRSHSLTTDGLGRGNGGGGDSSGRGVVWEKGGLTLFVRPEGPRECSLGRRTTLYTHLCSAGNPTPPAGYTEHDLLRFEHPSARLSPVDGLGNQCLISIWNNHEEGA